MGHIESHSGGAFLFQKPRQLDKGSATVANIIQDQQTAASDIGVQLGYQYGARRRIPAFTGLKDFGLNPGGTQRIGNLGYLVASALVRRQQCRLVGLQPLLQLCKLTNQLRLMYLLGLQQLLTDRRVQIPAADLAEAGISQHPRHHGGGKGLTGDANPVLTGIGEIGKLQ